jgi:NAD(P)-dependent dehydrogenase (short-subunit alcohol dehydrogenase family)
MFKKASEAMHPLGRIGKVQDVVNAIAFFLDPENDWITGQVLAVDGGLSSLKPRVKI